MSQPASKRSRAEREALRALCSASGDRSLRARAKELLAGYEWREPVNRAIFETLAGLPASDPRLIREQLPARLTRRGFPDLELDDLFQPLELSREEREELLRRLREEG